MRVKRKNPLFERQLHAEVRRILRLLDRTRRTREQVRLLIALETGASRRQKGSMPRRVGRLVPYRPSLPGTRMD